MPTMTNQKTTSPSIEVLLDHLGDFSIPAEPGDTDLEKELWLRKRVAALRCLIEDYPENDWVAPCLTQLWFLMWEQPRLFLQVRDSFGQDKFLPSGLYEPEVTESGFRAYESLREREFEMAEQYLAENTDSQGTVWAYDVLLERLETKLFDSLYDNFPEVIEIRKRILSTVKNRLEYQARVGSTTENETVRKYIDSFNEYAVEVTLTAVDSFKYDERKEQLAYLEKIRKLYPKDTNVEEKYLNLRSLGQPFALEFEDLLTGESIDTRDYQGNVVLIDIWATGCQPCIEAVPFLREFRDTHKELGLELVGLACDSAREEDEPQPNAAGGDSASPMTSVEQRVRDCAVEHGIDWPILVDSEFQDRWGITSIPRLYVIDREGCLCWIAQDNSVFEFVEELLKKSETGSDERTSTN